jgi:hypothetical protein
VRPHIVRCRELDSGVPGVTRPSFDCREAVLLPACKMSTRGPPLLPPREGFATGSNPPTNWPDGVDMRPAPTWVLLLPSLSSFTDTSGDHVLEPRPPDALPWSDGDVDRSLCPKLAPTSLACCLPLHDPEFGLCAGAVDLKTACPPTSSVHSIAPLPAPAPAPAPPAPPAPSPPPPPPPPPTPLPPTSSRTQSSTALAEPLEGGRLATEGDCCGAAARM